MKKQRYITPEEFCALPLSEAIIQVIYDMDQLKKQGVKLNMNYWATSPNGKICSVCLAGAALCPYLPSLNQTLYSGYDLTPFKGIMGIGITNKITDTFNHLRCGAVSYAFCYWYGFEGKSIKNKAFMYCGEVSDAQYPSLVRDLTAVSEELKSLGY